MSKKLTIRYVFWALTLAIMTFIFIMSNQTRQESSDASKSLINAVLTIFMDNFEILSENDREMVIQSFQFIVRKGAHFSVYAALGFCSYSAISTYNLPNKTKFLLSLGLCFFYSLTDEFHQNFVEGRACRIYDIAIDFMGSATGILFVIFMIFIFKKFRSRRMLNA